MQATHQGDQEELRNHALDQSRTARTSKRARQFPEYLQCTTTPLFLLPSLHFPRYPRCNPTSHVLNLCAQIHLLSTLCLMYLLSCAQILALTFLFFMRSSPCAHSLSRSILSPAPSQCNAQNPCARFLCPMASCFQILALICPKSLRSFHVPSACQCNMTHF